MDTPIVNEVVENMRDMPHELQWRVLEFARALAQSTPHGLPGKQMLRFAGTISLADIDLMRADIEKSCEQVDLNEW